MCCKIDHSNFIAIKHIENDQYFLGCWVIKDHTIDLSNVRFLIKIAANLGQRKFYRIHFKELEIYKDRQLIQNPRSSIKPQHNQQLLRVYLFHVLRIKLYV